MLLPKQQKSSEFLTNPPYLLRKEEVPAIIDKSKKQIRDRQTNNVDKQTGKSTIHTHTNRQNKQYRYTNRQKYNSDTQNSFKLVLIFNIYLTSSKYKKINK